jgi:hypothetical protein
MRYLSYAAGVVLRLAGLFLVLTAGILRLRGRPNSRELFYVGAVCFLAGVYFKRRGGLKSCTRCRRKAESEATTCAYCGYEFPANSIQSISEPFYK